MAEIDLTEGLRRIAESVRLRTDPGFDQSLRHVAQLMRPQRRRRFWAAESLCFGFSSARSEIEKIIIDRGDANSTTGLSVLALPAYVPTGDIDAKLTRAESSLESIISQQLGLRLQAATGISDEVREVELNASAADRRAWRSVLNGWLRALAASAPMFAPAPARIDSARIAAVMDELKAAALRSRGNDPFSLSVIEIEVPR
jgi:hypothetical protein